MSELTEKEQKEIEKEAKEILDKFATALEDISMEESRVEREQDRREEGGGEEANKKFREIMLKNAPKTKNDCIEAERGGWI